MTDESRPAPKLAAERRTKGKTAMPMNSAQLAELVIRARHKAPPVASTTIGATASHAGPSGSACTASTVNRTAAVQTAGAAGSVGCTVSPSLTRAAAETAANR